MKKLVLCAFAAALLCGCCSYTISKEGGRDMIEVENESLRLFGCFSIWAGDPEYANQSVTLWFCDSLLLDVNMMILDEAMRENGYSSFKDIASYKTKENVLFIFSRHCLRTSAELIR